MRRGEAFYQFDFSRSLAGGYIKENIWEILPSLGEVIKKIGSSLSTVEYERRDEDIWVHKTAKVSKTACIKGPLIVGGGSELRHCAFIRGNALIGKEVVVGNSTEIKNSILFDGVCAPHYNYIGDSVLGYKVHLGAGVIISNLRLDKKNIKIKFEDELVKTGLRKLGALVGDFSEIGSGSVLNPGTFLKKESFIYPLSSVK